MNINQHARSTRTVQINSLRSFYREVTEFCLRIRHEKEAYKRTLQRALKPLKITKAIADTKMSHGFPLIDKEMLTLNYPMMIEYFI